MYSVVEITSINGKSIERPYACYEAENLVKACAWHLMEWNQFPRSHSGSLAMQAPDGNRYSVGESRNIVNAETDDRTAS